MRSLAVSLLFAATVAVDSTPVYWNGVDAIEVARKVVTSGFLSTQFFTFDVDEQNSRGVVNNGTHVIIPSSFDAWTLNWARSYDVLGQEAMGTTHLYMFDTPVSLFPGTVIAFAEKEHLFEHTGTPWDRAAAKVAADRAHEMSKQNQEKAKEVRAIRSSLVNQLAITRGRQLAYSSLDAVQMQTTKAVHQMEGKEARMAHLKDTIVEKGLHTFAARADPATMSSMASSNNCFHFGGLGGSLTADDGVFVIPLDTEIDAYRGEATSLPRSVFRTTGGTAIWSFNNATGALEIFYGTNMFMAFPHPEIERADGLTPTFWIGPADGRTMLVGETDARLGNMPGYSVPDADNGTAFNQMNGMPRDYSALYEDGSKCAFENYNKDLMAIGAATQNVHTTQTEEEAVKQFAEMELNIAKNGLVINMIPCGNLYLRSDVGRSDYDIFEAAAYQHMLAELPHRHWWSNESATWREFDNDFIVGSSTKEECELDDSRCDEDDSSIDLILVVGIVAAVLIVIALFAVIMYVKRRSLDAASKGTTSGL